MLIGFSFFCGFIRFFTGKLRLFFQFRNNKLFIFREQRRVRIAYVYEVGKRHGERFVVSQQCAVKSRYSSISFPKVNGAPFISSYTKKFRRIFLRVYSKPLIVIFFMLNTNNRASSHRPRLTIHFILTGFRLGRHQNHRHHRHRHRLPSCHHS